MGGDNCLGDNCSRWELSGGIFRGGNCPRLSQVAVVWWAIDRGALDNCPHPPRQLSPVQLPSRQFPLRTIVPRQLPSREFLLRNIAPRLRTGQFPPIQDHSPWTIVPRRTDPRQLPPGQLPSGQLPPRAITPVQFPPGQLSAGQFPLRKIAPWTIPPDNSHRVLIYFPQMCFSKGRRCRRKKLQKVKQGARVLTQLKNNSTQPKFQTKVQCLFFCVSNFLSLIILQPETVKLNVTKSYILLDVVGVLALVQPGFLQGEVINLLLWTFYITMNCNNRNYYVSVSSCCCFLLHYSVRKTLVQIALSSLSS